MILATIILALVGWAWDPVDDITLDYYEIWCAKWGTPWAYCGMALDTSIADVDMIDEPVPAPGEMVCITIRSVGIDAERSELSECCGPCEEEL